MTPQPHVVIAVDGPAASGKSSVSRALATRLGITHVNSGSFYRAVTVLAVRISNGRPPALDPLMTELDNGRVSSQVVENEARVLLDGVELSHSDLSEPAVNEHVSRVSAWPAVRHWLLGRLRSFAETQPVIMEGRDIGTVVFPDAPFKFYLDANPAIREARRRAQGIGDSISRRDEQDSSRAAAPLAVAADARFIDSSGLSLAEVVEEIHRILRDSPLFTR